MFYIPLKNVNISPHLIKLKKILILPLYVQEKIKLQLKKKPTYNQLSYNNVGLLNF